MITTKLSQLLISKNALEKLGNQPLKGKLAYKVGKVIKQISDQLNLYDQARYKLLEQYCVKDENNQVVVDENGNVRVKKENIGKYNEEIGKLNNTEIELNIVPLDLEDFENIEMTPKEIMEIDWVIKKEEAL